jgi:hypothetical protein
MESLEDRLVIVQLSQRGVQFYEKHVVDARVADVMTNRRDE